MFEFSGKSLYKGIAVGEVIVWKKNNSQDQYIQKKDFENEIQKEIQRVNQAVEISVKQLQKIYEKALKEVGENNASIFQAHELMLKDKGFLDAIYEKIRTEKVKAERAVELIGEKYALIFRGMSDEYMKARAEDINDIVVRLIRNLQDNKVQKQVENNIQKTPKERFIIIADDLTPSETIQLDKKKIAAFVTLRGSVNSHTAILAKMMNIPALVSVPLDFEKIQNGMRVVVDGFEEKVIFDPTEKIWKETEEKLRQIEEKINSQKFLKENDIHMNEVKKISIYANVGNIEAAESALENGAEGIGLFRSECLYLNRSSLLTEEEQFSIYKELLQKMEGRKTVIRTLDIGADKQAEYFNFEKEENPALGYRGIRICLKQPEIFKTQLRALFRAAVYGKLSVVYPMITSMAEITKIYTIIEDVKTELQNKSIPYKIPEQGIMIETPAAVMLSDEIAEMVDFVSIGTNDLTQYTLAIDRMNENLSEFYDPNHKAVLKMIKMVVNNVHKLGKKVGICGELAADTIFANDFVKMGVDELSVEPSIIPELRKKIKEID